MFAGARSFRSGDDLGINEAGGTCIASGCVHDVSRKIVVRARAKLPIVADGLNKDEGPRNDEHPLIVAVLVQWKGETAIHLQKLATARVALWIAPKDGSLYPFETGRFPLGLLDRKNERSLDRRFRN